MLVRIWAMTLLLASCTTIHAREGVVLPGKIPQAAEQCRAQPWLDWCHVP